MNEDLTLEKLRQAEDLFKKRESVHFPSLEDLKRMSNATKLDPFKHWPLRKTDNTAK